MKSLYTNILPTLFLLEILGLLLFSVLMKPLGITNVDYLLFISLTFGGLLLSLLLGYLFILVNTHQSRKSKRLEY